MSTVFDEFYSQESADWVPFWCVRRLEIFDEQNAAFCKKRDSKTLLWSTDRTFWKDLTKSNQQRYIDAKFWSGWLLTIERDLRAERYITVPGFSYHASSVGYTFPHIDESVVRVTLEPSPKSCIADNRARETERMRTHDQNHRSITENTTSERHTLDELCW